MVGADLARARRRRPHHRPRQRRRRAGRGQRVAHRPRRRPPRRARRRGGGRPPSVRHRSPPSRCGSTAATASATSASRRRRWRRSPSRAVDLLRRVVDERPGELAVVTLGPLSNVARVLADDPTWASRVGRLVVMAGSVAVGGNATRRRRSQRGPRPGRAGGGARRRLARAAAAHRARRHPRGDARRRRVALCSEQRTPAAAFCDGPAALLPQRGRRPDRRRGLPRPARRARSGGPGHRAWPTSWPVAVDTAGGPAWGATIVDRRRFGTPADGFARWCVALHADVERFRAAARTLFGA